jgi:hypothetical protein
VIAVAHHKGRDRVKDKLYTLKRHAGRCLGVLAVCATTAAVPLALGSGTPAGASPVGPGCHIVKVPNIPHGHGDFYRTITFGICKVC